MEYFQEFCSNTKLIDDINKLCETNMLSHALLIVGEKGTGKNLFSRLIARRYLEDTKNLVERNIHPDFIVVKGKTASGEVSVSQIRETILEITKSAVSTDGKRVVLIENVKTLNRSSFAALLKIIEQPPQGVLFILSAESRQEVADTILSRCVVYYLEIPTTQEAREFIQKTSANVDEKKLETLLEMYGGRIGLVQKALNDDATYQTVLLAKNIANSIVEKDEFSTLAFFDIIKDRTEFSSVIYTTVVALKSHGLKTPQNAKATLHIIDILQKHEKYSGRYANLKLVATSAVSEIFSI